MSTALLSVPGAALYVAAFVQLTKGSFALLTRQASSLALLTRVYVFAVSGVAVLGYNFLTYHLATRADLLTSLSRAASVAVAAIVGYHVLSSNALPSALTSLLGQAQPSPSPSESEPKPAPTSVPPSR